MKTIFLWFLAVASALAIQIEVTDTKGRRAKIDNMVLQDGVITATNADGKVVSVPLEKLSEVSRKQVIEESERADAEKARAEDERPKGIIVMSLVVKRIKASSIGGTFRYFFSVRNYEAVEWSGTVKIRLVAQNRIKGKEGEFKLIVHPNGSASGYFDASTGPPELHGEYGVTSFEVAAKDADGKPVAIAGGPISSKYIDEAE